VEHRVVACIDLSPASAGVMATAMGLARGAGGALWLLHVAAGEPAFVGDDTDPAATHTAGDRRQELLAEKAELQAMVDEAMPNGATGDRTAADGVMVTPLVVVGPTVDTVLETAQRLGASLIVVGRHGRRGLAHMLLGSVSEAIVRRSGCPVVVVPPSDNP
jgi:nucleotide-binding universal stress UspA family protein